MIIGNLNINSISIKFEQVKDLILTNIDILVVTETKVDDTFFVGHFFVKGFSTPYRLDRNRHGGGIMIFVKDDIPSRVLNIHDFPGDIEGLFVELNFRKTKWLLFGTYHPPSQNDQYYFDTIEKALDRYRHFENVLLVGDFNAEEHEICIDNILLQNDLKNLVKEKTCYKNPENPSCIDLFLTSVPSSFQNTKTYFNGF